MPYHATPTDHGANFTFDRGGTYERIDDGTPQQRIVSGEFAGFELSETRELAASKTPEAAVFAQLRNLAEGSGNTATSPLTIYVYELTDTPDVDLSDAIVGDFALLEEVRYETPSETPIDGTRIHTVTLPGRAAGDADLAYLPDGPHIIRDWADAVKQGIQHVIAGHAYPEDIAAWSGVERPDITAYRAALH